MHLQTVYFPVLQHLFSVLCVLMEILSHVSAKKKAEGFQILHFYWLFSNDIMAVKGLTGCLQWRSTVPVCLSLMCFFFLLFFSLSFFTGNIEGDKSLKIYVCRFLLCFIFGYGLILYIWLEKSVDIWDEFWSVHLLMTECPYRWPCAIELDVKIQLASITLIVTDFIIFRKLLE